MKTVLVVGSGQLGTRHLQAVASLSAVEAIHVLDPSLAALDLGRERLGEIDDLNEEIAFGWHESLDTVPSEVDLCIVATQAGGRAELIEAVAQVVECPNWLLEKIVEQSIARYGRIIDFAESHGLSVWVNCKTRDYGVHRYIKSRIDPSAPISFVQQGGSHGLANNGVHSADLFVYYDGARELMPVGARVDPILLPSKRGSDLYDLGGSLYATTAKGSDYTLSYSSVHASPDHVSIVTTGHRFIVDHMLRWARESSEDSDWQWRDIPIDENWSVSHMTKAFARDILATSQCALPTLAEAFPAHRYILGELKPHFERLLGRSLERCPVT